MDNENVKKMSFLPSLKDYLRNKGEIYTVRTYEMCPAIISIDNVGLCQRLLINKVDDLVLLSKYVDKSGFDSLDSWKKKINQFIPEGPYFLYKITLLKISRGSNRNARQSRQASYRI